MSDLVAGRSPSARTFAVIPAAGRSRRMGLPKLLLKLGNQTVIAHVIAALQKAGVFRVVVVVHPDDAELRAEVESCGGFAVCPSEPPAEMRQSVEIGLDCVRNMHGPQLSDYWLLVPADHPIVDPRVVQELMNAAEVASQASSQGRDDSAACGIWIPTWRGRRGHPTLFRWDYADRIASIPVGHGVNWLVKQESEHVCTVSVVSPSILWDMDTPEDYAKLCARYQKGDV